MAKAVKTVLICVSATFALGVFATTAQALTHDWGILSELEYKSGTVGDVHTFADLGLSEESVSIGGGKSFKFSVPGLESTIECKKVGGTGSLIEGGTDSLKASLSSCKVLENELCTVTEPIAFSTKTELVLVGNYFYHKMIPLTEGKPFATVQLTGVSCELPKTAEVTGAVATEISTEKLVEQPLTMSEAISKKVNEGLAKESKAEYKLEFGKQAASLDAQLLVELTGEYGEAQWRDDPIPVLCETAGVATCPAGKAYMRDTTVKIESEAGSRFIYNLTIPPNPAIKQEAVCQTVKFEGKTSTTLRTLVGDATTTKYEECGGCAVTKTRDPVFKFTTGVPLAPGNGYLTLFLMEVKITCQGKTCQYFLTPTWQPIVFDLTGGGPAKAERTISVPMTRDDAGSDAGACSQTGTWQGVNGAGNALKFKFPSPNPLYVAY